MNLPRPLAELLPHAGRMRLIDRVLSHDDERIVCEADSHRAPDHPLAVDGVLAAACGLEYGAQAMAIHGALVAHREDGSWRRPQVGYIVAAHELQWFVERLDRVDAPLTIEASRQFASGNQVSYDFAIRSGVLPVMRGRASVMLSAT